MEEKTSFVEPLLERAEEYGKTTYELIKLKAVRKTAGVASSFVSKAVVVTAISMFALVLNIGVALWLGDLLGKSYYGFFCVAGFYAILSIIFHFFLKKWLKERITNLVIMQILN